MVVFSSFETNSSSGPIHRPLNISFPDGLTQIDPEKIDTIKCLLLMYNSVFGGTALVNGDIVASSDGRYKIYRLGFSLRGLGWITCVFKLDSDAVVSKKKEREIKKSFKEIKAIPQDQINTRIELLFSVLAENQACYCLIDTSQNISGTRQELLNRLGIDNKISCILFDSEKTELSYSKAQIKYLGVSKEEGANLLFLLLFAALTTASLFLAFCLFESGSKLSGFLSLLMTIVCFVVSLSVCVSSYALCIKNGKDKFASFVFMSKCSLSLLIGFFLGYLLASSYGSAKSFLPKGVLLVAMDVVLVFVLSVFIIAPFKSATLYRLKKKFHSEK